MKFESGLPMPKILQPTDVIVKVLKTTICGTDLQILKGNVFTCDEKRRIGHEGIGEIIEICENVKDRKVGMRVLVSSITACGECLKSSMATVRMVDGCLGMRLMGCRGPLHAFHMQIILPMLCLHKYRIQKWRMVLSCVQISCL